MTIEPLVVHCTLVLGYYDEAHHCVRTTDEPAAVLHWPYAAQLETWIAARVQARRAELGLSEKVVLPPDEPPAGKELEEE